VVGLPLSRCEYTQRQTDAVQMVSLAATHVSVQPRRMYGLHDGHELL